MIDVQIIDDFLTPTYADFLENQIQDRNFPWFFNSVTTDGVENQSNLNHHGFVSVVYDVKLDGGWVNSPISIMLRPFLFQIQDTIHAKKLMRSRIDMTVCNSSRVLHSPHQDLDCDHITTIYYVNDSDGYTLLYNEKERSDQYTIMKKVTPKKNRLLIFDGAYYHTGHSPMQHKNRILINSNFS